MINIIYASWFGNGKKVIEELAEILIEKKQDVKLFSIMEKLTDKIPDADLYIFSSPTRKFSLPANVREFITGFIPPKSQASYALMTTYMDPRTIALKKMESILNSKGMLKAAKDFKVKALGLRGSLKNGYTEKLRKFAEEIITKCQGLFFNQPI
jgi:flavorubredoxin